MDEFLRAAIDEAKLGVDEGGLPIGSVLVPEAASSAGGTTAACKKGTRWPTRRSNVSAKPVGRRRITTPFYTRRSCPASCAAARCFNSAFPRSSSANPSISPAASCAADRRLHGSPAGGVTVADVHDPECIEMMWTFVAAHPDLWNQTSGDEISADGHLGELSRFIGRVPSSGCFPRRFSSWSPSARWWPLSLAIEKNPIRSSIA